MDTTTYDIEMEGGAAVIRFQGTAISHEQMLEINQACEDKLRYDNTKLFIFDLTGVELFASACIGALVELLREVEPTRGRIAIASASENVAFLFRITKLEDIFGLYDDVEDALHELKVGVH